jgi:hypothetical protein
MTDAVIPTLTGMAKQLFNAGRFVGEEGGRYRYDLDNVPDRLLDRAVGVQAAVERSLSDHLGRPVALTITTGADIASKTPPPAPRRGKGSAPGPATTATTATATATTDDDAESQTVDDGHLDDEEQVDVSELTDATDVSVSGVDKVVQAFPGAQLIEKES